MPSLNELLAQQKALKAKESIKAIGNHDVSPRSSESSSVNDAEVEIPADQGNRPKSQRKKQVELPVIPISEGEREYALTTITSWLDQNNIKGYGRNNSKGNPTKKKALQIIEALLKGIKGMNLKEPVE